MLVNWVKKKRDLLHKQSGRVVILVDCVVTKFLRVVLPEGGGGARSRGRATLPINRNNSSLKNTTQMIQLCSNFGRLCCHFHAYLLMQTKDKMQNAKKKLMRVLPEGGGGARLGGRGA